MEKKWLVRRLAKKNKVDVLLLKKTKLANCDESIIWELQHNCNRVWEYGNSEGAVEVLMMIWNVYIVKAKSISFSSKSCPFNFSSLAGDILLVVLNEYGLHKRI